MKDYGASKKADQKKTVRPAAPAPKPAPRKDKLSFREQRELEMIDARLLELSEKK